MDPRGGGGGKEERKGAGIIIGEDLFFILYVCMISAF